MQKEDFKKLANDLKKFRLAVENASDHIIIADPDGKIIYANKAVEGITGYSRQEIIGAKPSLWGRVMPLAYYKKLWKTIKYDKKPYAGEITNRRKSGEKYTAEVKISPILDEKREVIFFVGIERDITKEKELDRSKTEFISMASHQLRTPLASIGLAAEMLAKGYAGDVSKEQVKYLKSISGGIREMAGMIEFLLNISRIEMGALLVKPEPVDFHKLLNTVLKEFSNQLSVSKLKLKKRYQKDIPEIGIDVKLMRLILENLISNAVKYNKRSGSITVETKKVKNNLQLEISDTGNGISKIHQGKIFTKFFRAAGGVMDNVSGTGLGLYISKKAVDEYGGKIWFESEEGKGSTFYLTVPLSGMRKSRNSV